MMDMCGGVGQQKQRLQNMKIIVSSKDTANEKATDTTLDEHIKKNNRLHYCVLRRVI